MTATDTIAATTPIAMRAVARHMLRHSLTVDSLERPRWWIEETAVGVHIDNQVHADAWAKSINVDHEHIDPLPSGAYEQHVRQGRLPVLGIRVRIITTRRVASHSTLALVAVPALVTLVCDLCNEDDADLPVSVVSDDDTLAAEHGWTTTPYGTHRHIRCDQIEMGVDL